MGIYVMYYLVVVDVVMGIVCEVGYYLGWNVGVVY